MLNKYTFIVLVFILGLVFYMMFGDGRLQEGFKSYRCPNILIQKGSQFYLFNSNLAKVPGVNPVIFKNLEDYKEFTEWQRSQGINCPVLFVQQVYDTQGNIVYQFKPSPTDLQGGRPLTIPYGMERGDNNTAQPQVESRLLINSGHDQPPYNWGGYPAFDQQNQDIGVYTPLDKMEQENKGGISPNAMDPNWGGQSFTERLVQAGYYKPNEVSIYVP
jgi:hypothetical protein